MDATMKKDMYLNTAIPTVIAAALAYMAFDTGWHSALFGFMAFTVSTVGNRVYIFQTLMLQKIARDE